MSGIEDTKKKRGTSASFDNLSEYINADDRLTDEHKVQVLAIMESIKAQFNSIGNPSHDEKYNQTYTQFISVYEAVQRAVKNGDTDGEKIWNDILSSLPEPELSKRMTNAFKRLKEKGYYFNQLKFPLSKSKLWDKDEYEQALFFADTLYRRAGFDLIPNPINISDDTWFRAIELTILIHNYDLLTSPDFPSLVPTLEKYKTTLGHWVILLALLQAQLSRMVQLIKSYDVVMQYYWTAADAVKKSEEAELRFEKLEQRMLETEKKCRQLEAERREDQKTQKWIRHEYANMLRDKDSVIAELQREIAVLSPEPSLSATIEVSLDEAYDKALYDIELPEDNIIFLGGHDNLVDKLSKLYPHWTYMNSSNYKTRSTPLNPIMLFIFYKHLGHKDEERISKSLPSGTPMRYVSSTNLAQLELQLKREYARVYIDEPNNPE